MAKVSLIKQSPAYDEYHTFLKDTEQPIVLKDYKYYLKQYSFLKGVADAMPCAMYMLDYSTKKYLFVSQSCEAFLGYTAQEYMREGQILGLSNIHPEDLVTYADKAFVELINYTQHLSVEEVRKCRFSVNYRIKRKDGVYIKVLQQTVILEANDKGYPILTLGILTDITAHKPDNKMVFSISYYDKQAGFKTISSDLYSVTEANLTPREKEIIKHIVYGHTTPQIAELLFLSVYTIRAHRRNIFEKTKCKNIAELVNYAINNGVG